MVVRLETVKVGGTTCTSQEALQRFFDRLSGNLAVITPPTRTARQRERDIRGAEEYLKNKGSRGANAVVAAVQEGDGEASVLVDQLVEAGLQLGTATAWASGRISAPPGVGAAVWRNMRRLEVE